MSSHCMGYFWYLFMCLTSPYWGVATSLLFLSWLEVFLSAPFYFHSWKEKEEGMHRKKSGTVSQNTQATAKRLIFEFSDDTPYRFFISAKAKYLVLDTYRFQAKPPCLEDILRWHFSSSSFIKLPKRAKRIAISHSLVSANLVDLN